MDLVGLFKLLEKPVASAFAFFKFLKKQNAPVLFL